jgi:hypothetical protein
VGGSTEVVRLGVRDAPIWKDSLLGATAMAKTVRAVFDGEVLRPEEPVDLRPDTTYVVTIERETPASDEHGMYPLTEIAHLATDMGVADLSVEHSRYAHGRAPHEGGGG